MTENSWFVVTEQNNSKYEWNNERQELEVIRNVSISVTIKVSNYELWFSPNKWTRIYMYSYYFFTMLMHIELLLMHNAYTFAIFHVGHRVLQFRKYAFQQLRRFNYIVAWYVNSTTTLILFRPCVSTRNRFSTWFRKSSTGQYSSL